MGQHSRVLEQRLSLGEVPGSGAAAPGAPRPSLAASAGRKSPHQQRMRRFPWALTGWLIRNKPTPAWPSVRPPSPNVTGCEEEDTRPLSFSALERVPRAPRSSHRALPPGKAPAEFPELEEPLPLSGQTMPSCGSSCFLLTDASRLKIAASVPELISRSLCPAEVLP